MTPGAAIKSGDWVYFYRNEQREYCYRMVRAVKGDLLKIYHLGNFIYLKADQIQKVVRSIGKKIRGKTPLSEAMYQKGVRNEDLADKSGYSVGTVDRARRGLRVKAATLTDLMDSVAQL